MAATRTREVRAITFWRGIAVLLVIWDHIAATFARQHNPTWPPLRAVDTYATKPLIITQNFGWLGVVLFFLISGFIVTHVAMSEARWPFLVKRAFRILPGYWLSLILLPVFFTVSHRIFGLALPQYSMGDFWQSVTFVGNFRPGGHIVNGAAWTLVIEVIFYALVCATLPLLRRYPIAVMLVTLGVVQFLIIQSQQHGDDFFLITVNCSYLVFLVAGQIIYFAWSRRIRLGAALGLFAVDWIVFVNVVKHYYPDFYTPEKAQSYGVSFGFAVALFVGGLLLGERLVVPRLIAWVADISYSVYLYHVPVAVIVFGVLQPRMRFTPALLITLAAVFASGWALWRWVERPAQRYARKLLTGTTPRPLRVAKSSSEA